MVRHESQSPLSFFLSSSLYIALVNAQDRYTVFPHLVAGQGFSCDLPLQVRATGLLPFFPPPQEQALVVSLIDPDGALEARVPKRLEEGQHANTESSIKGTRSRDLECARLK